jgi:hypothetical protein
VERAFKAAHFLKEEITTMFLEMKETRKGSLDGVNIKEFKKGEIYEFKESIPGHKDLAEAFLKWKYAERVKLEKVDAKTQPIQPDETMFMKPDQTTMENPESDTIEKKESTTSRIKGRFGKKKDK